MKTMNAMKTMNCEWIKNANVTQEMYNELNDSGVAVYRFCGGGAVFTTSLPINAIKLQDGKLIPDFDLANKETVITHFHPVCKFEED